MTRVFESYQALRAHQPATCKDCGSDTLYNCVEPDHALSDGTPICLGWTECADCGYTSSRRLFVAQNAPHPILTEREAGRMKHLRVGMGLSLLDLQQQTMISVSRLSDIERRYTAPSPAELSHIEQTLGGAIRDPDAPCDCGYAHTKKNAIRLWREHGWGRLYWKHRNMHWREWDSEDVAMVICGTSRDYFRSVRAIIHEALYLKEINHDRK